MLVVLLFFCPFDPSSYSWLREQWQCAWTAVHLPQSSEEAVTWPHNLYIVLLDNVWNKTALKPQHASQEVDRHRALSSFYQGNSLHTGTLPPLSLSLSLSLSLPLSTSPFILPLPKFDLVGIFP